MLALALGLWLAAAPAPPAEAHFLFAWRGVPVGSVTLSLEEGGRHFRYASEHLHTREGHVAARRQQARLALDAHGAIRGTRQVLPQALWLWQGPPPPGCVQAREELTGREGPHCVLAARLGHVEGTLLGAPFEATYAPAGQLQALRVGSAHFRRVAPGLRLRPPPDLFAQGVPVEGALAGALAFARPGPPAAARPFALSAWHAGPARALAAEVHAALPDKRPSAEDLGLGEDGAGGCLAHALRFARLAAERGQRVALVHGLLAEPGAARAFPHAWVRVGLQGGATLDLDPTSLEPVTPATHLPLALAAPGSGDVEAGERWLALLAGEYRILRH
jgi:hypothetical protein